MSSIPSQDTGGNQLFLPSVSNITDISLISIYWSDILGKPSFCNVAITANYNDLINLPSNTGSSSVVFSGDYNSLSNLPWINYNSNISFIKNGNIGIGTTNPNNKLHLIGNFSIEGNIIPTITDNFNLGSSNFKWKDLYLSGNSIYLDNLILSKNSSNNLEIKDSNGNLKNLNLNSIELNNLNNKVILSLSNGQLIFNSNGTIFNSINFNNYSNIIYSNVLSNTSNSIINYTNSKVDSITIPNTDTIFIGTSNKFITSNIYSNNLTITSNLFINGNYYLNNNLLPFTITSNTSITTSNGLFSYINNSNFGYYSFLTNGSITFPQSTSCDILVVGQGGNGGNSNFTGGGGAGEVIAYKNYLFNLGTYNIQLDTSNTIISSNNSNIIVAKGGQNASTITYQVFNYTGTIQTFTIPTGITSVNVYCWGAAGSSTGTNGFVVGFGGAGGFVKATLDVTSISSLAIIVGQGGAAGDGSATRPKRFGGGGGGAGGSASWPIGTGGGLSGIFVNNANMTVPDGTTVNTAATPIIISGGGGGAGGNSAGDANLYNGGNGGGDTADSAINHPTTASNGTGGSQSAGGTTGGSKFSGGTPSAGPLAGGGGGYYGGGFGAQGNARVGGAGGGSSYVNTGSFNITNITNLKNTTTGSRAVAPGNTEKYYVSGIGAPGANNSASGNGLVVIEYVFNSISGGSGSGGFSLSTIGGSNGNAAGTKWDSTNSYVTAGYNGTSLKGGDGGSALITGGYTENITSTNLIVGVGGIGASSNSVPILKYTYGSGGDGNGGLGTEGIVIIKVPLNIQIPRFDGYINYSNINNRPVLNELITTTNYLNLGYNNQVNFPLANVAWKNEWFLYIGNSPTNQSNSFIFWHLASNINSKWWFNGTQTVTNNELSDRRIKKDIIDIQNPLEKLMFLKPKEYYLCDDKDYLKKYGIIAQDVYSNQELNHLVYKDEDYIANIYTNANYVELIEKSKILLITNEIISDKIKVDDELKILLDNINIDNKEIIIEETPYHNRYKKRYAKVKSIINDYTIEIYDTIELLEKEKEKLFIYGKKVYDFNKLDYSSLYSLNIASTQELYKLVQEQNILIENLKNRIELLENKTI